MTDLTKNGIKMELKKYSKSLTIEERKAWAIEAGTNDAYLSQITTGKRKPSPELARALAEKSGWKVHPAEILPVFAGIPEFKPESEGKKPCKRKN
jgi:DNA-binding transcriptional regulator YdaS (Cro superfamily)